MDDSINNENEKTVADAADETQTITETDDNNYGDSATSHSHNIDGVDETNDDFNSKMQTNTDNKSIKRQHNTSKTLLRAKDSVHKCQSDLGGRYTARSQVASTSQSRSLRFPSTSATSNLPATTRKCVLTLDGYNYVIGKLCYNSISLSLSRYKQQ